MKGFFALYDREDNFISCGFSRGQLERKKEFGSKIYRVPINRKKDKDFIEENKDELFTNKEKAMQQGLNERTFYRRVKNER